MSAMTAGELEAFLYQAFPQLDPGSFEVRAVSAEGVQCRYTPGDRDLRPGGTVSGPTLMMLSDTGMYLALLSRIGPVALAVTTSLAVSFLRKPVPGPLDIEVRLLKLGKRLAVGDVLVRSEDGRGPVSHATVTYSIPPSV